MDHRPGPRLIDMRSRRHQGFTARIVLATLVVAGAIAVAGSFDGSPSAVDAAATQTVAMYEMNESSTATVLVDTSGNGLNGAIGPNAESGVSVLGATAHRFLDRSPTLPPTEPERLDTVAHSPLMNPDSQDFAVTVRYRTTKPFGNLVQKGQNGAIGGYFKIELPFGRPTCLFKGIVNGVLVQHAVEAPENMGYELNDNVFHTITCERLQNRIALWIDGVEAKRFVGATGNIANDRNLSIAGKSNCDQVEITCDYFVGDIDWVKIQKGDGAAQNTPPVARFTDACAANVCTLNGSTSTDGDGSIVSWAWEFGDGTTGTGQTTTHAYATAGNRTARLTVTDDKGATHSVTHTVSPGAPPATTSTTSTTTTIVAQLPPGVLEAIPDAATAGQPARRVNNASPETGAAG
jgi:hypothetical protein